MSTSVFWVGMGLCSLVYKIECFYSRYRGVLWYGIDVKRLVTKSCYSFHLLQNKTCEINTEKLHWFINISNSISGSSISGKEIG